MPTELTAGAWADPVVRLDDLPVFCNALATTAKAAANAPRGCLELAYSPLTGYLWNRAFDPALTAYSPAYENALHYSPRFVAFAEALADRLIDRYGLHHRRVVEIGAGEGNFLAMLCERGPNDGVGFDPSHDPTRPKAASCERVRIEAEYYPTDRPVDADLVLCQHVLEHVPDPSGLVRGVRRSIPDGQATAVYFEVPDATYMVERLAVWDLIYEHCSYFAAPTLRWLFERCGFEPVDVGRCFGDQYLYLEAVPAAAAADPTRRDGTDGTAGTTGLAGGPPADELAALGEAVSRFGAHVRRLVAHWEARLGDLLSAGPVAVWGAGSKGVTFLNLVAVGRAVSHVVDVNPNKAGLYVPGSAQVISRPGDLVGRGTATVLVMNPLYVDEVKRMLADLDLSPEVIAVSD